MSSSLQLVTINFFHDISQVHNCYPMGKERYQSHIMANEHKGYPTLLLEAAQKLDNSVLYGYVQGTGGLIANDNLRLQSQSSGNGHTLPLAATHIVWITICKFLRQLYQL